MVTVSDRLLPDTRLESRSLLERIWNLPIELSYCNPMRQGSHLAEMLAEASASPLATRRPVLSELMGHLELFNSDDRERLMAAQLFDTAADVCDCANMPGEYRQGVARRLAILPHRAGSISPAFGLATARDDPLVVLVIPDFLSAGTFLQPPLEALLAASRLRRLGFRCRVLDNRVAHLDAADLAAQVDDADLLAVLTTPYDHIQNYFVDYRLRHALATADHLKRAVPSVPLVLGGAHGTVRPDIMLRDCSADYVVRGEFDTVLPDLVQALRDGAPLPPAAIRRGEPMKSVGVDGAIPAFRLVDLDQRFRTKVIDDDHLRPAYDLIDLDDYYGDVYEGTRPHRQARWVTLLANRGCAHDCSFCFNFWGRRTRRRDPEDVADELAWVQNALQARGAFFLDFNFSENPGWIEAFCASAIRRGVTIPWSAQTRCDQVDEPLLHLMRSAGCHGLWFGVESFDEGIVESLGKYGDKEAAARALTACARAAIKPHLFVMIGVPGETRRSLNSTIRAMHRWKAAYCGVMPTTPRFGTRLYAMAKQQFPMLGNDFYSLRGARGLVGNDLTPIDLHQALEILNNKNVMEMTEPPQLSRRRL